MHLFGLILVMLSFNETKTLITRIQTNKNKCIRFCLQLDNMKQISYKEFEILNWVLLTERFNQCISLAFLKYFNNHCPNSLNEIFEKAPQNYFYTRRSFQTLKCPFCKTNMGQIAFS